MENSPSATPADCIVSISGDGCDQFIHRPDRGVLVLPNRIAIDFGPGMTELSPEAQRLVSSAASTLALLSRTVND